MNDDQFIKVIKKMNRNELMTLAFACPEYLSDGYYGSLGAAMYARYDELIEVEVNDEATI